MPRRRESFSGAAWPTARSPIRLPARAVTAIDETNQNIEFTVTADDNSLFDGVQGRPKISGSGTLTFTLAPNKNGSTGVTVIAKDNGVPPEESASQRFTINVEAINDAPQFTLGNVLSRPEDDPSTDTIIVATQVRPGPLSATDETGQNLTFDLLVVEQPTDRVSQQATVYDFRI